MKRLILLTLLLLPLLTFSQTQLGSDIDGEAASDQSGYSVSIDSDGSHVAIGAIANDGTANNAGHVRIFEYSSSSWNQVGNDIDGEATWDQSGRSVSIDSDGSHVAIGATGNDGNGSISGHVRIYSWGGSAWSQVGSDIDGEAASDYSGVSVSIDSDGSHVAIGAYYNDGNGSSSGHVRIYSWDGSAWNQLGNDIDGEAASDYSGVSVSIDSDGSHVAIGAYQNDGNGSDSGHVRIYSWDGSAWNQLGNDIDGEAAGDYSGYSVSIDSDGSHVAIGAINNDGNGSDSGHVRIYSWDGSAWSQVGNDIDGEAANDSSGYSVSIDSDGSRVAIGAYGNDGNGSDSGHVRLYSWDGSAWSQAGSDIDGEAASDYSGLSVSIDSDGSHVAIGAYGNDGNGSMAGHVRIYEYSSGSWSQVGTDIDGEAASDSSGYSVSIDSDGSHVAIGATGNAANGSSSGHVRIFTWDGSAWNQVGSDIDGEAANDYSGSSVSIDSDGSHVAIGANGNDGNGSSSGHVRIYEYSSGSWSQVGNDIDGEAAFDYFGHSVSMDSDGSHVAIGAYGNDGNGSSSGHVRIYEYSSGSWSQVGSDIDGEAANDYSGRSVSIDSDGSHVAIGAYGNGGNGTASGHVRIYEYSSGSWSQVGNDIDGEAASDNSGTSVSIDSDGSHVAIGADYNDGNGSNSGHVRIYSWDGSAWAQRGNDVDGEAAYDESGFSVSMDSDGSHVAIGAPDNDGTGSDAGHVRVWAPYGIIVINHDNLTTAASLTTSGATTAGSLTVDSVVIDGTTIGHSSDSDLMTLASGSLTVAGDVTISSDARLKSNIVALGPTLISLLQLEAKSYTMKNDAEQKQKIGLLAQEVQKVFPELVSEDNNGMLAVNYQALVPVLINALKEQENNYNELEKSLEMLEKEVLKNK